jgi:hypothetical protein
MINTATKMAEVSALPVNGLLSVDVGLSGVETRIPAKQNP